MKLKYLISIASLPLIAACTMETMTTDQITQLYADSTSLSSNEANANYYAPDGTYRSTNLETGAVTLGSWYAKDPDEICIVTGDNERCFAMAKSDTSVSFEFNGNTSTRNLNEYMSGDKTADLMKSSQK